MSKRLFLIAVLVLVVGFFTRAFADIAPLSPTQGITRADAVALLINADAAKLDRARFFGDHMPPLPLFTDTVQTQWYAPYLETAFEEGLITGSGSPLFRPMDMLTQDDAVALVVKFKELDPTTGVYLTIDHSQGSALNKLVSEALANNIKPPFPLRPGTPISAQDFYTMLASAGIDNPQNITIASIPVTTQFVADLPGVIINGQVAQQQPVQTPLTASVIPNTDTGSQSTYFAISMPSIGIQDLKISHPTDLSHDGLLVPLKTGVGHLFSYPGQGGKILVYGHSSSYPWDTSKFTKIFRQINRLTVGDRVYINYHGTVYTYQVTSKETVPATDTSSYAQEGKEELILYTCWPPDSIKQRYLVHAMPVSAIAEK